MSAVYNYKKTWQLQSFGSPNPRFGSRRFSPYDLGCRDDTKFCRSYGYDAKAIPLASQNDVRAYHLHIPDRSDVIPTSCSSDDDEKPLDLRVDARKRKHSATCDPLDEFHEASPPPPSPREELTEIPADPIVPPPSTPTMAVGPQVPASDPSALAPAPARELEGYRNGHFVLPSLLPFPSMEHQASRSGPLAPSPLAPAVLEPEENLTPSLSEQPATASSSEKEESTSFVSVAADVDDHFKQALGLSVFASVCKATPPPPSLKRMRSESASPSNTVPYHSATEADPKSTSLEDSALVPLKRRRSNNVSPSNSVHSAPTDDPKSTSVKDSVCPLLKAYLAADFSAIAGKPTGRKRLRNNKKATVVRQRQKSSKVRPNSV